MPLDQEALLALGELRGVLKAMAWANCKCDHYCTFTVTELAAAANIEAALQEHFQAAASVWPVEEWQSDLSIALRRWLFDLRDLLQPRVVWA